MKIDNRDKLIIEALKRDARATTRSIATALKMPITTVHNRIKRLEREGVIKGYTTVLDPIKIGRAIAAYILVTVTYNLPSGEKINQHEVGRRIRALTQVEDVCMVTGATDIVVKVRVGDMHELNKFITDILRDIDGVDTTQTLAVLEEF